MISLMLLLLLLLLGTGAQNNDISSRSNKCRSFDVARFLQITKPTVANLLFRK